MRKLGVSTACPSSRKLGLGLRKHENLDEVAGRDCRHQQQDDGFNGAHPETLESEEKKYVESSDDDSPEQRDVEEQIEGDGAAEYFCQVTGTDGEFAEQPVGPAGPFGIPIAAALGKILACDDTQAGRDDLHEDGHETGEPHNPEQGVFELGATLQIRAPVSRVHVADANEDGGAHESAPLFPETRLMMGDVYGGVDVLERQVTAGMCRNPARIGSGRFSRILTPAHRSKIPKKAYPQDRLTSIYQKHLTIVNYISKLRELKPKGRNRVITGTREPQRWVRVVARRSCQRAMMPRTMRLGNSKGAIGGAP